MDLDDAITIITPEGVELRVVLAGAGSRFIAGALDVLIQVGLLGLAALVTLVLVGGGVGEAAFFVAAFCIIFAYYILWELLSTGRTAGKHLTRLRVVREGGGPVDLPASAVRTLLRLIDLLPSFYLLGLTCIVLTRRNQRLGDLAAGTLVIREARHALQAASLAMAAAPAPSPAAPLPPAPLPPPVSVGAAPPPAGIAVPPPPRPPPPPAPPPPVGAQPPQAGVAWDTSAVSAAELVAVQRFLERRHALDAGARAELARRLANGLWTKVPGAQAGDPEQFLEVLARVKAAG